MSGKSPKQIIISILVFLGGAIILAALEQMNIQLGAIPAGLFMLGFLFIFSKAIGWNLFDKKKEIDGFEEVVKNDNPKGIIEKQEPISTKSKSSKKKWIWVSVGIVVVIIIVSAIFSSVVPNEDISLVKTNKSEDFSEQSGDLYRNTRYNFRIKFPEGWEIKSGDGPNILQKAVKENSSINIGVREIPAEYSDETATIKDVMSLAEFKDSIMEGIQEKFPGAKLLDYGETKLDNIPTYWVKYSAPYSALDINVETVNLQYQLLNKNIFYFITSGTLVSEFSAMEPEFKKSISTFVIENY